MAKNTTTNINTIQSKPALNIKQRKPGAYVANGENLEPDLNDKAMKDRAVNEKTEEIKVQEDTPQKNAE